MRAALVLLVAVAAVVAMPREGPNRIVGGSVTTINEYPYSVALLHGSGSWYSHHCGGSIINNRSVLTAAHCIVRTTPAQWRSRVGSSWANSGGVVYATLQMIQHPFYNPTNEDNDVAILRISGTFTWTPTVQAASIAGANYNLLDNQVVWAIGWGLTEWNGQPSEQLRHVQVWTVNQVVCAQRYAGILLQVTENMLCSGWLDVGGRDQCRGDSGGPLIHNNVVVGVCSWGNNCATPHFPGVNVRVSRVSQWIVSNA